MLALCLLLAVISVATCAWLIERWSPMSLIVRYVPGAILGACVLIVGQMALGWTALPIRRAAGLLIACLLAWRLAQYVRLGGAPFPWVSASVVGCLGVATGAMLAWPHNIPHMQLLVRLALVGLGCGALFVLASELRLTGRESFWSFALLWTWQAGVLSTVAASLRQRSH